MASMQRSVPQQAGDRTAGLPTAKIVKRQDYTDDLFNIWLEPSVPFTFKPGQYITIGAGGIERPYSIASSPHERLIELFIEFVKPEHGGKLTPLLYAQRVADVVTMRPRPKGIFTFQEKYHNHVLVGTVTGVAPYASMLRNHFHNGKTGHRFFVMEGASHFDEFVYDKEFLEFARRYPGVVEFVGTVSRPQAERNQGWTGLTGRVNTLVERCCDGWGLPQDDTLIYLCGNPGMIEDVKARMGGKGWNVMEERFWKDD